MGLWLDLLQEWTRWEDNCGRLSKLLDDLEAFISSGEPEGDDEKVIQHRQDACQVKTLLIDRGLVMNPTAFGLFTSYNFSVAARHHIGEADVF